MIIGWSLNMTVKLLIVYIKHGSFECMGQLSRPTVFHKAYMGGGGGQGGGGSLITIHKEKTPFHISRKK